MKTLWYADIGAISLFLGGCFDRYTQWALGVCWLSLATSDQWLTHVTWICTLFAKNMQKYVTSFNCHNFFILLFVVLEKWVHVAEWLPCTTFKFMMFPYTVEPRLTHTLVRRTPHLKGRLWSVPNFFLVQSCLKTPVWAANPGFPAEQTPYLVPQCPQPEVLSPIAVPVLSCNVCITYKT